MPPAFSKMVELAGVEPAASSMPRKRDPTSLQPHDLFNLNLILPVNPARAAPRLQIALSQYEIRQVHSLDYTHRADVCQGAARGEKAAV